MTLSNLLMIVKNCKQLPIFINRILKLYTGFEIDVIDKY